MRKIASTLGPMSKSNPLANSRYTPPKIDTANAFDHLPAPTRAAMAELLAATEPAPMNIQSSIPGQMTTYNLKRTQGDGGFMGPIGKLIDIIDTPRAAIVSTVKEIGDLFQGEGFSPRDWWKQTGDNMFFGEVLEDWGGTTGNKWLDFALGFVGDVALDPLTYLAGAGLVMRGARVGQISASLTSKATELRQGADMIGDLLKAGNKAEADRLIAELGGDATQLISRADKLTDAAVKVENAKGAGTAAGREALEEIGIDVGIRTTMFGTGRIGRTLIEKPLNQLSGGRVSAALDARRAAQVPQWIGDMKVTASADEIARATTAMRKGDTAILNTLDESTKAAARTAMRMPVQTKRFMGIVPDAIAKNGVLPWGTNFIEAVFPAPGRLLRAATQRSMIQSLDAALNSKQPIRGLLASNDPDMVLAGIELRKANNGRIRVSSQFKTEINPKLERAAIEGRRLGISNEDLLTLSETPLTINVPTGFGEFTIQNPNLPQSVKNLDPADAENLHGLVRDFWDSAATYWNEIAGESVIKGFIDDLYAARYLSEDGRGVVFASDSSVTIPLGGRSSSMVARNYLSPEDFILKRQEWWLKYQVSQGVQPQDLRNFDELSPNEVRAMDERFRQTGATDEFMGQKFESVTGGGRSIRDQITEIGRNRIGDNFVEMFEKDFVTVGSRYLRSMSDEIGRHHMLNHLADSGVLFRDPNDLNGRTLRLLEDALEKTRVKQGVAQVKAAMAAAHADEAGSRASSNIIELQYEASRLEDEVSALLKELDSAQASVRNQERAVTEVFEPLVQRAAEAGKRVEELDRLVNALNALDRRVKLGASGTSDVISTDLTKQLESIRQAIRVLNKTVKNNAELDEAVQGLKDILRHFEGHDPKHIVNKEIREWSKKLNEIQEISAERLVGLDDVTGVRNMLEGQQARVASEINKLKTELGALRDAARAANPRAFKAYENALNRVGKAQFGPLNRGTGQRTYQAKRAAFEKRDLRQPRVPDDSRPPLQPTTDPTTGEGVLFPPDAPAPFPRPKAEGIKGVEADLAQVQEMINLEKQTAANIYQELFDSWDELDEATREIMAIEAKIHDIQGTIEAAASSQSLSRKMTALESHEDAIKAFNKHRQMRNFQKAYSEAASAEWGMSGYRFIQGSADDNELMAAVFDSLYRVNNDEALRGFFGAYDKLLSWWKAQAISSPGGFSARNFMGGIWINNIIAGVEMGMHGKVWSMYKTAMREGGGDLRAGIQSIISKNKTTRLNGSFGRPTFRQASVDDWKNFDQLIESGVGRGGQVAGEIDTSLESVQRMARVNLGGREITLGRLSPISPEFMIQYQLRNVNEQVEFVLRNALGLDVMSKGGTIDDVFAQVHKYHFDYTPSGLTMTERRIRRAIPFWRWQKNIIPVLVESLGRKPTAWSRLMQLKGEMELQSEQEGVVPDYFLESWGIRLPFKTGDNQVYWVPDLPFRDLMRYTKEPTSPLRTFGESAAPPLKLIVELWAGKQVFADIPFTGRYQQTPNIYNSTPFLMEALGAAGKATKNWKGEWKMRDHDIYIMDQMMPMFGRFRRLWPNEDRYQQRVVTTWVSNVFGTALRTNTPREVSNQWRRDEEEFSNRMRDIVDLQLRER